jgi:hypothetical protein
VESGGFLVCAGLAVISSYLGIGTDFISAYTSQPSTNPENSGVSYPVSFREVGRVALVWGEMRVVFAYPIEGGVYEQY